MHRSAPVRFGSLKARPPLVARGQRIGVMGGSFNPPHEAHRTIAQVALKRLRLDKVWWVVTPGNPLKSGGHLKPLPERIALAEAMAADRRIVVTAFEKDLPSRFTAGTLGHLTLRFPDVHFVWLMGADCLASFDRWLHWRHIFELMPIAVVDRPGWRHKALGSLAAQAFARSRVPEARAETLPLRTAPAWTLLTGPLMTISSTAIRAREAQNNSAKADEIHDVARSGDGQGLKVAATSTYPASG